jgi:hypothetical protein
MSICAEKSATSLKRQVNRKKAVRFRIDLNQQRINFFPRQAAIFFARRVHKACIPAPFTGEKCVTRGVLKAGHPASRNARP